MWPILGQTSWRHILHILPLLVGNALFGPGPRHRYHHARRLRTGQTLPLSPRASCLVCVACIPFALYPQRYSCIACPQAIFEMPDCPDILGTLCCSAFILTKERIAAIPRGVFERAMRFMNGTVLPVKLRSPVNAEDHKAQRIFDKIQPQQFWTNYEANCKTPPGSKLGYCAGAVARHKIEGVQIEHLWQAMLGEPFWLPPNVFPEFEPRQLRSHLWKLKDPKVKDQITEKYEKAFGEQYRAQIFSRGQMGLGMIEQHLKYKPLPVVQC